MSIDDLAGREWMDVFPVAACLSDEVGEVVRYNQRAVTLWGRAPHPGETEQQLYGGFRLTRLAGDPLPAGWTPLQEALQTDGSLKDFILVLERPERVHLTLQVSCTIVRGEGGTTCGALTCLTDLSGTATRLEALHQQARTLRHQDARFRQIVEIASEGIWILDARGATTFVNQRMADMLGYPPNELTGQPLLAFVDDAASAMRQLWSGEQLNRAVLQRDFRFHRRDGSTLWTILSSTPIYDGEDQLTGVLAMVTDITARKQMELELTDAKNAAEAASQLKDEFLATVSHELRTPLTPMLGWAQMLRSRPIADQALARGLEVIERGIMLQTQLINDLLDVSRIISGKLRFVYKPTELLAVLLAAIDTIRPAAEARAIRLETTFDSSVAVVIGNHDRLQQVVWNLLSNAVKFTPRTGLVQVRLERDGVIARISVRDTGEGISPDFLPHLFQRFRQADGTITRVHSGLGLGLSIARHLVELHGGTIRAESAGKGLGATFIVELPLSEESRQPADVSPAMSAFPSHAPLELSGLKLLLLDDNSDSREFLSLALQRAGARVIPTATEEEALAAFSRERPDVFLADLEVSGSDRVALLSRMRECGGPDGAALLAVTMSSHRTEDERSQTALDGFQLQLTMPIRADDLISALVRLRIRNDGHEVPAREDPST